MFHVTKLTSLVVLVAAAVGVHAQAGAIPSSLTDNLTPCALSCLATAAENSGCTSATDIGCVCTSQKYQSLVVPCLQNCGGDALSTVQSIESYECGNIASPTGGSPSTSALSTASTAAPAGSTAPAISGSSTVLSTGSAAPGASGSNSSSGSGKGFTLNFRDAVGAGVAAIAAIAGAGLVL
ncbi:hypothetical protein BC835DRAFT_1385411 [Cytidiella melzeri]|nr:hypothetical protein BC835DRAFT_1385411 [Cytidiella melzeri]